MEQKLTPEEKAFVSSKLEEAKMIAYTLGEQMFKETNDIGVSVHAACILYATTCAINNIDPSIAKTLFERIHQQVAEAMDLEGGTLQ